MKKKKNYTNPKGELKEDNKSLTSSSLALSKNFSINLKTLSLLLCLPGPFFCNNGTSLNFFFGGFCAFSSILLERLLLEGIDTSTIYNIT